MSDEEKPTSSNIVPIRKELAPWEPLNIPNPRVNPAAVEVLEDLLAIAKRGELHGFVAIWTEPDAKSANRSMAGVGGDWSNINVFISGLFGCATRLSDGMWP